MLDQYLTFKGEIKNMLVKLACGVEALQSTIPIDRDLRKNTHRLKSPKCYLYKKKQNIVPAYRKIIKEKIRI